MTRPSRCGMLQPVQNNILLKVMMLQFILSAHIIRKTFGCCALDGKIKAWMSDNLGSRVDYDAPGRWCTTMAYSADDGTRLFSCGTSKDGESYIVEWNESEGAVERTYQGFRKRSFGVVQFNTTTHRFLAAGDDFSIKFWDMDNIQLLTTADADGGLPVGKPSHPPQQGWHSLSCFCQ